MHETIEQILVIGTGAYVCGKVDNDYGTILPGIFNYAKEKNKKVNITFACNTENGSNRAKLKSNALKKLYRINNISFDFILCNGCPNEFFQQSESKRNYLACIISIPDNLHYTWAKDILIHRIPLLVVKPLTLSYSESHELTCLAKKLEVPSYVEFHKRYDRQLRFIKDKYISGEIGLPLYSITEYTQKKYIPMETFRSWSDNTNIFSYLGVHYIDIMYYIYISPRMFDPIFSNLLLVLV